MPQQRVITTVLGRNGKRIDRADECGGVFVPVPGKTLRPAYGYGPGQVQDVMFQCPVSAIPQEVFTLLSLWWQCHAMRVLPVAGAFVDQPLIVRVAFPVFEGEWRGVEQSAGAANSYQAATMAAGAMAKMFMGGK